MPRRRPARTKEASFGRTRLAWLVAVVAMLEAAGQAADAVAADDNVGFGRWTLISILILILVLFIERVKIAEER